MAIDNIGKEKTEEKNNATNKNEELKKVPLLLGSSKLSSRNRGFDVLYSLLDEKEFSDVFKKGISKLLISLIPSYNDRKSQYTLMKAIERAIQKFGPSGKENWIHFYNLLSLNYADIRNSTIPLSRYHLFHLQIGCSVWVNFAECDFPVNKKEADVLLGAISIFFSLSICESSKKLTNRSINAVKLILKSSKDLDGICEAFSSDDSTLHKVILGGWLFKHLSEGDRKPSPQMKISLIQSYVKIALHSKKKPCYFVEEKTSYLLKQLTHEEFSQYILPVAQKSLLRNPEVILETIGFLFQSINIDMSRYVTDLLKVLESPLHAKEDQIRDDAVFACHQLAKQCSDQAAIQAFVKLVIDIYSGVYGKLAVNSHKISILQALEKLSEHGVTGNAAYSISEEVSSKLLKVLETETHEASLIQTLSTLTAWASKFRNEMPEKIVAFIPKGLSLKTSTVAVRTSYLRYLHSCLNSSTTSKFNSLVPCVLQLLEKIFAQPSQIALLGEALSACNLLLQMSSYDMTLEPKIEILWSSALDLKKNYFVTDKFLSQAPDEALLQLVLLCKLLLSNYQSRIASESKLIHYALVWCLICSSTKVRQTAQTAVKSLCSALGGHQLVLDCVTVMADITRSNKPQKEKEEGIVTGLDYCCAGVIQGLLIICSTSGMKESFREKVALQAVHVAFSTVIMAEDSEFWEKVCKALNVSDSRVIKNNKDAIIEMMTDNKIPNGKQLVIGFCQYGSATLYPDLISYISERLDNPLLNEVTEEEVAIYNTPEGTLYNQSAVDQAFDIELNLKNVKKTSKAYTHKEQVMMLEEKKKELEKKRREGKLELTPKQKEVEKNELEKESVIRARIQDLNLNASIGIDLLHAAIEGNIMALAPFMKTLIPLLMKSISSYLVGKRISLIVYELRKSVFTPEDELFAATLARTTLRVYKCHLDNSTDWDGENEVDAAYRTLQLLQSMTSSEKDEDNYLTASGLVYSLPMLEYVIFNWPGDVSKRDSIALATLNIIKVHMAMRAKSLDSPYHPKYLPREQLLKLLISIISTKGGRIQQSACVVLQDVCVCASGQPGCDRASQEEISILLNTLTAPAQSVRDASLRGLNVLIDSLSNLNLNQESWKMMVHRLWVSQHDEDEDIKNLTLDLWNKAAMKPYDGLLDKLLEDVTHSTAAVRSSAATALAALITRENYSSSKVVDKLIAIYKKQLEITPAKKDQYDHVIEEAIDHWEGRSGVGLALFHIAPFLEHKSVIALTKFFVPDALGDRSEDVRKEMLMAGMAVVNHHGKDSVNNLLPVFEKFLNTAPNNAKFDAVRQNVVIIMGSLAKHLDQSSPKIKPIVVKLVDALNTPSQQVQESIASCLHPLVPAIRDECPKIVNKLMKILLDSNNYGQRKGAAYGLASIVKGLGILSLKQLDIMNKLTTSIQDKKIYRYREGALFAIEQLCNMLGKLFEPYIVHILPHLLLCFGDSNSYVRDAAEDTAKAVMSKLSAHGVKLVLPSLLAALKEDSWRTKTGSVELLGNMAFCAPKQLSSCLPSIVPRLIEVLSDSHQNVQVAGGEALKLIGSVIRNPEIQAIVPVLLKALEDPSKNTSVCLQTLLETKFVHFIDAPSLALIMPVVQRAFQDRSTEVRKMSAQIIGNMYSLTDQKDLAPYLPSIIPGLKASLLDPVPKVRSVSARALGAMVKGMGESSFDDLLPWLMQTLTSEASPVDRSGAAQGLAEVVGGLGPEKLHRLMPDIVATAERSDIAPHVKDGYIMMFIFLPTVFEDEFTPYIGNIISPILKALADETEFVRDTALKAGQRIVNTYAASAVTLLLPELENGLFHDNWRIRFSSVQLLGDLLYRVSGVSGKMTTDTAHEDDNFGTEHSQKAIMNVLGAERRNRVLAGLYMGRSDVALMVRQAALHVWKVVVTNTPKTLREILPTLFSLLLTCLASKSLDKRQVAARTLGDLVRKLGERVLPEIIPILEAGLDSEEADHRQGVCIGLSEIMASTSKDMVLCFTNNLVPTVRRALCDPLPAVRSAAAHTFDSLHSTVGVRALDEILPNLLELVQNDDSDQKEYALDGLKQVMTIKSRVVLPYLIPQLTAPPVNTQALCILSSVAGDTLTKHLHKILPALLTALSDSAGTPAYDIALSHCQEVVLAVNDDMGVNIIVDELLTYSKNRSLPLSRSAVALLLAFCSNTRINYTDYAPLLIRGLIQLLVSPDKETLQTAWNCLGAVTKSLDAVDQKALVNDVRQAVKFAAQDLKGQSLIPGFCLPKGIQPVLPIFREAVLNGEPDQKEAASRGLTEVIRLTSSDALKTSVIHITGPLIRILGDRFTWNVKVAVLDTLALLLEKAGPMLKPFLPQLQTTFVKAVHDPHRGVRLKAGNALSHLIAIHTKPDPLFTELHNAIKSSDDPAMRETMLQAIRSVVGPAGFRMSESVSKGLTQTLTSLLSHEMDSIRLCAAGALGVLLQWISNSEAQGVVDECIFDDGANNQDWRIQHGMSAALFSALKSSPKKLLEIKTEDQISQNLLKYLSSDRVNLVENGVVGVAFLLLHQILEDKTVQPNVVAAFARSVNHSSNEVKQAMCRSCQFLAEQYYNIKGENAVVPTDVARPLMPMLVNASKEKNPIVRSSAEMALIAILKLKEENNVTKSILNVMSGGARDSLSEVINKHLQKTSYSKVTPNEMDMTILT